MMLSANDITTAFSYLGSLFLPLLVLLAFYVQEKPVSCMSSAALPEAIGMEAIPNIAALSETLDVEAEATALH